MRVPAVAVAPVTRVVAGDTFEARIGGETEDVRPIGIDTPETVKPGTPVQCYRPRPIHIHPSPARRPDDGARLRR
jgi:endonuclease YncB( thermonuclease family)